jgi:hypothetical protein
MQRTIEKRHLAGEYPQNITITQQRPDSSFNLRKKAKHAQRETEQIKKTQRASRMGPK